MWLRELQELFFPSPAYCHLCRQRPIGEGLPCCKPCLDLIHPSFHQLHQAQYETYAITFYQGYIKQILNRIKYQNDYQAAKLLGKVLGLAAKAQTCLQRVHYFAPVPLHPTRLKQRGFNQAAAFVDGMNQVWRRPVLELIRTKDTVPQNDLAVQERVKNMHNAFALAHPGQIKGRFVLVVDDIYTTGATFNALADLLNRYHAVPSGLFLAQAKLYTGGITNASQL